MTLVEISNDSMAGFCLFDLNNFRSKGHPAIPPKILKEEYVINLINFFITGNYQVIHKIKAKPKIEMKTMNITKPVSVYYKEPVFIADNNIGDIAKYMRMLGFDVVFDPTLSRQEIISTSKSQNRILLTRSKNLFNDKEVLNKVLISSKTTAEEVVNIIQYLGIKDYINTFSRCLLCNTALVNISKKEIEDKIPPKVKEFCNDYTYCRNCDKIYWQGTHFIRMKKIIDDMLERDKTT